MQSIEILKQIASILEQGQANVTLVEASNDFPYPRLLVFLGNDYKNRERILALSAQGQSLVGLPGKHEMKSTEYIRVQFQTTFPFLMKDNAVFEVGSLLHFINHVVELPGFEMDELDNKIFYRYVLLSSRPDTNPTLYFSILGLIMMLLDLFTEAIEKLATGEASFNEMLEQMIELTRQIQPNK